MKEFIELIKKLWSNKKHRSIAILLIYLVFFMFVFLFLNNVTPTQNSNNLIENKKYKLQIIGQENFIIDNNIIIYQCNNYSIESGIIDLNKYNIKLFTIDNINNFINNGKLETVNYINNSKSYLVSISNIDNTKQGDFRIIVYNNKIEIDLINHFNYKVVMEF